VDPKLSDESLGAQVLQRAFALLNCFSHDITELSLQEISKHLSLPKPTVHRILSALKHFDFVEQDEDTRKYRLGWKMFELGSCVDTLNLLKTRARPHLQELCTRARETVHLAVLRNSEILYVDKIMGPHRMTMITSIGLRLPSHVGGLGKCLLAFAPQGEFDTVIGSAELKQYTPNTITDPEKLREVLAEVRTNGFAIDNEEVEIGLTCIAAPLLDGNHNSVGAISIAGPKVRMTRVVMAEYTKIALEAAARISHDLGCRP
jgi:IclR family transcriptional regulator, KDG regulon repressor